MLKKFYLEIQDSQIPVRTVGGGWEVARTGAVDLPRRGVGGVLHARFGPDVVAHTLGHPRRIVSMRVIPPPGEVIIVGVARVARVAKVARVTRVTPSTRMTSAVASTTMTSTTVTSATATPSPSPTNSALEILIVDTVSCSLQTCGCLFKRLSSGFGNYPGRPPRLRQQRLFEFIFVAAIRFRTRVLRPFIITPLSGGVTHRCARQDIHCFCCELDISLGQPRLVLRTLCEQGIVDRGSFTHESLKCVCDLLGFVVCGLVRGAGGPPHRNIRVLVHGTRGTVRCHGVGKNHRLLHCRVDLQKAFVKDVRRKVIFVPPLLGGTTPGRCPLRVVASCRGGGDRCTAHKTGHKSLVEVCDVAHFCEGWVLFCDWGTKLFRGQAKKIIGSETNRGADLLVPNTNTMHFPEIDRSAWIALFVGLAVAFVLVYLVRKERGKSTQSGPAHKPAAGDRVPKNTTDNNRPIIMPNMISNMKEQAKQNPSKALGQLAEVMQNVNRAIEFNPDEVVKMLHVDPRTCEESTGAQGMMDAVMQTNLKTVSMEAGRLAKNLPTILKKMDAQCSLYGHPGSGAHAIYSTLMDSVVGPFCDSAMR